MSLMAIEVQQASEFDAMRTFTKFAPDLINQLGYQVGWRTGESEDGPTPTKYDTDIKTVLAGCPLFEGLRPAISYQFDPQIKSDVSYPSEYNEVLSKIAHRFVWVFLPEPDGQFRILFVQSGPENPEGLDDVHDKLYDYAKARQGGVTQPFFNVATDIVDFLIDGKL